ncbi:CHC2 zinc finger domain-containing protein, partial [Bacteroidales bacterium OttesenSCG-928-B11]|nr:CHC2 zinc finger domain-containing protein [Bacteroidales bacterium OttesenSCG-928-B11]
MEIQEIKSKLSLASVLQYYGLTPDRNNRLRCPFHNDRTPSLQVYPETNTCYCFSGNCKTHGKSMDVIDFVMNKENTTKHEALKICAGMAGGTAGENGKKGENGEDDKAGGSPPSSPASPASPSERSKFLERMFSYFRHALPSSQPAREYMKSRGLAWTRTEAGYNSGQFHHGSRKEEALISQCLEHGLLLDKNLTGKDGAKIYGVFGKGCLCFALRDREENIAGLYFRSISDDKEQRHFYLKNRKGLYPGYPQAGTRTLILTESVIDAASLVQLTSDNGQLTMNGGTSVLALYGTNGLTEEHREAIGGLAHLEEVIFFLNGDEPGKKATEKHAAELKSLYPRLLITAVPVPENEDVNSLLQGHEPEILTHLIENRREVGSGELRVENSFLSTEPTTETLNPETLKPETLKPSLDTANPHNLRFRGKAATYQIRGFRAEQGDSLKIT